MGGFKAEKGLNVGERERDNVGMDKHRIGLTCLV